MNEKPIMSKQELLAALRASGEQVLTTLRALPAATFERTCYDQGWTGRQILAHIASIEWTYPRLIALAERATTPSADTDGAPVAGEAPTAVMRGGIDAYNERQVAKRAHRTIAALLDEFARNRAATIAAVAAMDAALLPVPIRSAGGITGPLGGVIYWMAIDHVLDHLRDIVGNGECTG